jgi:hypothetical protein
MNSTGPSRTSVLAATFVLATSATLARAQRHPLYDDGGTLAWSTTLDAGKQAARKVGKLLFVEVGTKT